MDFLPTVPGGGNLVVGASFSAGGSHLLLEIRHLFSRLGFFEQVDLLSYLHQVRVIAALPCLNDKNPWRKVKKVTSMKQPRRQDRMGR